MFQAKKAGNLLHKIGNNAATDDYYRNIVIFSQQLVHRIPVFSCGLFSFDFGLGSKVKLRFLQQNKLLNFLFFTQMLSAIAVYFVILVQFEERVDLSISSGNTTNVG